MDQPVDPTQPQQPDQPQHAVLPTTPGEEVAPGTVLPAEDDRLDERGDENFQSSDSEQVAGEGGEGGEPYDGGEIPQVDESATDELATQDSEFPPQQDDLSQGV
jgi:hypothetical protein